MARTETGNGGRNGRTQGPTSGLNIAIPTEQFMLVVANNNSLTLLIDSMYDQMSAKVAAMGGTLEFTLEQYTKYVVTAIKVRVEFVLRGRWRGLGYEPTGMDVRDRWVIPVPVHDVLSAIGRVVVGASGLQISPLWASEADDLVLTRQERDFITPRLQSAAQACGFKTLDSISADQEGHQKVMILTYLPTRREWWATEPVGREDGSTALVTGLIPVTSVERGRGGPAYTIVDTEQVASALELVPAWIPPLTLSLQTVVRYTAELADMSR